MLSRTISYIFTDQDLVTRALTHRSAGNNNNERLEFLGDAILGFVIADVLFSHFPDLDEGQLSRLRAGFVKRDTLVEISRQLQLGSYLILGPGELRSGGQSRGSILEDALEALFAAVYLDGGYEAARAVILNLFKERLNCITPDALYKDPKTQLQEHLQAHKHSLPAYRIDKIEGEQHEQTFTITCQVADLKIESTGVGGSRRKAEQIAASKLLQKLQYT